MRLKCKCGNWNALECLADTPIKNTGWDVPSFPLSTLFCSALMYISRPGHIHSFTHYNCLGLNNSRKGWRVITSFSEWQSKRDFPAPLDQCYLTYRVDDQLCGIPLIWASPSMHLPSCQIVVVSLLPHFFAFKPPVPAYLSTYPTCVCL